MKKFLKNCLIALLLMGTLYLIGCSGRGLNKDEQLVKERTEELHIGMKDEVTTDFELPKFIQGDKEFKIVWKSSDEVVIQIKEYQDPEKAESFYLAAVEMQPEEKDVILTATVEYKEKTAEKEFEIHVLADEYTGFASIAEAKNLEGKKPDETKVKFSGTVALTTKKGFLVHDDTGNAYCYVENHGRTVGEKVIVRGVLAVYNNMVQFKNVAVKSEGMDDAFDIESVAASKSIPEIAETETKIGEGHAESSSLMFKTQFFVKENPSGSYNKYSLVDPKHPDKFIEASKYNDEKTLEELGTLIGTDEVKYYEGIVIFYVARSEGIWDVLFVPGSAKPVTITLTDEEKVMGLIGDLKGKFDRKLVFEDLELPLSDPKTGAVISWASSQPDIISESGKYTAPSVKSEVILTATITLNDYTTDLEIKVNAKAVELHRNLIFEAREQRKEAGKDVPNLGIKGVVVGVLGNTFVVQDEEFGILVYNLKDHGIKAGDTVYVEGGVINDYNGLLQIKKTGKEEDRTCFKTMGEYFAPVLTVTTFDQDALKDCDNRLMEMHHLEYVEGKMIKTDEAKYVSGYKGSNIKFKIEGTEGTITGRTDAYIDKDIADALCAKIDALNPGDKVSIVNATVGWFNGPQISLFDPEQIQPENTIKTALDLPMEKDDKGKYIPLEGITVSGVVTSVAGKGYTLQDGYHAIKVLDDKADHGLVKGDFATVTGKMINNYEIREIRGHGTKTDVSFRYMPLMLTADMFNATYLAGKATIAVNFRNLKYVEGKMIEATDAKYISGYKGSNITFEAPDGTRLTLRTDGYTVAEEGAALALIVNNLRPGDVIDVKEGTLGFFNNLPQINISQASQIKVNTVAVARNNEKGAKVAVEGIVTYVMDKFDKDYYIQCGDYAIMVYRHQNHGFVAGDKVRVEGTLDIYNGLYEIKEVTNSEKIEAEIDEPRILKITAENAAQEVLAGKDCRACQIDVGAEAEVVSIKPDKKKENVRNIELKFPDGTTIAVRNDPNIGDDATTALLAVIDSLQEGTKVSIKGLLGWFFKPQIIPIEIEVVSPAA